MLKYSAVKCFYVNVSRRNERNPLRLAVSEIRRFSSQADVLLLLIFQSIALEKYISWSDSFNPSNVSPPRVYTQLVNSTAHMFPPYARIQLKGYLSRIKHKLTGRPVCNRSG